MRVRLPAAALLALPDTAPPPRSDSNYRQDKFLRGEAEKEEQGFVPLGVSDPSPWITLAQLSCSREAGPRSQVIASFKRMQALSEDLDFIAKSLKDSNTVVLWCVRRDSGVRGRSEQHS